MNKNLLFSGLVAASIGLAGCSKDYVEGYEESPNNPTEVPIAMKMSSAQVFGWYAVNDNLARVTNVIAQQMTGSDRQFAAINRYVITGNDLDDNWDINGYPGALRDLKLIIDQADEEGSPHYKGAAQVMSAMIYEYFTSTWGDIPMSEALGGTVDDLQPAYDSQRQVYEQIFSMLDEAITNLNDANNAISLGDGDIMYGGDTGAWIKLANHVRARAMMRTQKRWGDLGFSTADVITALDNGFASSADDAVGTFEEAKTKANLWYQFLNVDRQGYITQQGYMYNRMAAQSDPREYLYRDTTDALQSAMPAFSQPTSELNLATYAEAQFIRAEALLMDGNTADAETAYQSGMTASMDDVGVMAADRDVYLAAYGTLDADQNTAHEQIMYEKYVATVTMAEGWFDWKRTGYPDIQPVADAALSQIPRRMPYPQTEYLYNLANVPLDDDQITSLTTRVWWDVE